MPSENTYHTLEDLAARPKANLSGAVRPAGLSPLGNWDCGASFSRRIVASSPGDKGQRDNAISLPPIWVKPPQGDMSLDYATFLNPAALESLYKNINLGWDIIEGKEVLAVLTPFENPEIKSIFLQVVDPGAYHAAENALALALSYAEKAQEMQSWWVDFFDRTAYFPVNIDWKSVLGGLNKNEREEALKNFWIRRVHQQDLNDREKRKRHR